MTLIIPTLFGIEGIVSQELKRLGAADIVTHDGKVEFTGDYRDIAKVNLWIRSGERVLIKLGEFKALTFDELFEGVKALEVENYIGKNDEFPVKGYSLKSKLFSVPDCQSIIKKALVNRLSEKYHISWFEETGPKKQIQFSIFNDIVTVMLDTTGPGLHKRGYRAVSNEAPLRETLAAAIISLTHFRAGDFLYDPFCGSGTISIEAAMYAANIAPGLKRRFAGENFPEIDKKIWLDERLAARDLIRKSDNHIFSSDIDPSAIKLTLENAKKAGVEEYITAETVDVKDFKLKENKYSVVVCNPPYGERLMEQRAAEDMYKEMGGIFKDLPQTKFYILTSHEDFESLYGKKADKNRKLYNGMIKCYLFQYFK